MSRIAEDAVLLHIGEPHHYDPFGEHLDAEGIAAGHHHRPLDKVHLHLFDRDAAEHSQPGGAAAITGRCDLTADLKRSADGKDPRGGTGRRHIEVIRQDRPAVECGTHGQ